MKVVCCLLHTESEAEARSLSPSDKAQICSLQRGDTPVIGGVCELKQDKENFECILSHVQSNLNETHGICILVFL